MTASHVLNSQQWGACPSPAAHDPCRLASGVTLSLRPAAAMQLRVVCGQAWVTLDDGPHGWYEASGDRVLQPGQSLRIGPGRHAVVEPLGHQALQYQWCSAG